MDIGATDKNKDKYYKYHRDKKKLYAVIRNETLTFCKKSQIQEFGSVLVKKYLIHNT